MSEDRKTFTVPDGFEAVFSADGRATGEVRKTRETLEREASHWLQQARDNLKAGQDCLAKLEAAERKAAELEAERDDLAQRAAVIDEALTNAVQLRAAAEADKARLSEALRWAHDTLYEINISNYDHDEICRLNDASVEVILGLAQIIGEKHGKTDEWWAEYKKTHTSDRAALSGSGSGWQNPLEHAVEFVAKMAWRTDPPNANNKLTDTERLSAIKYHPTIKGYAKPHIELAEREAASPSTAGER